MAIKYNFYPVNDSYTVEVDQRSTVVISIDNLTNINELYRVELFEGEYENIKATKDGRYIVEIYHSDEKETFSFDVTHNLEYSIINDMYFLLCGGCGCDSTCSCGSSKEVISTKNIFIKIMLFQAKYIPTYGKDFNLIFNDYLVQATNKYNCNIQTKINEFLKDECDALSSSTKDLMVLYLAIFWTAMYFHFEEMYKNSITSLDYIKTKFKVKYIKNCLCSNTCVDFDSLRDLFEQSKKIINNPPYVADSILAIQPFFFPETLYTKILTRDKFTNKFQDNQNDIPNNVVIKTLPSIGYLKYEGSLIGTNFIFNIKDVEKLSYNIDSNYSFTDSKIFKFASSIGSIIEQKANLGYKFSTYENGVLNFAKTEKVTISNTTNIYAFLDTTSMLVEDGEAATNALDDWYNEFKSNNLSYKGKLYIIPCEVENWLSNGSKPITGKFPNIETDVNWNKLKRFPDNMNTSSWVKDREAIVLNFVDEAHPEYHGLLVDKFAGQPKSTFMNDYKEFMVNYKEYEFFKALVYPIVRIDNSRALVKQMIAALEGRKLTQEDIDLIDTDVDLTDLKTFNPYENASISGQKLKPLKDFNWSGVYNKKSPAVNVFNSETFKDDLNYLLTSKLVTIVSKQNVRGVDVTTDISFNFQTSDNNINELYSNMAKVIISIEAYNNLPISQLGDRTISLDNRETFTYTVNDFTVLLVPEYLDPEGDPLDAIRVDSLPSTGTLLYNGNAATIGQVVTVADLAADKLTYVSPDSNTSAATEFDFSARDTGSLTWIN